LLVRYGTSPEGKPVRKAEIYTATDHHLDPKAIDNDARRVIQRLRREGFKAYIVGGAVRDLLTGLMPKDFDIATDAHPRRVRRIFPRSRIIGRRFRLVHVYVQSGGEDKIFEVSTFRALHDSNNVFGSLEEDAWRRDFSINALYYCPEDQTIIDFVGGFRDIRERRLRTLAPTEDSFSEDPVRMIRGIKYAAFTGFPVPGAIATAIRKHREGLRECSAARLTEELYKILGSGFSAPIFQLASRHRVLEVFLPALDGFWKARGRRGPQSSLEALDRRVRRESGAAPQRGVMLAYAFRELFRQWDLSGTDDELCERLVDQLRRNSTPLIPSRRELESAARTLMKEARKRPRKGSD
jgi:poly(A) polymerase